MIAEFSRVPLENSKIRLLSFFQFFFIDNIVDSTHFPGPMTLSTKNIDLLDRRMAKVGEFDIIRTGEV